MINFIKEYLRVALGLLDIALMILLPAVLCAKTGSEAWLLVYVALVPLFFMDPSL